MLVSIVQEQIQALMKDILQLRYICYFLTNFMGNIDSYDILQKGLIYETIESKQPRSSNHIPFDHSQTLYHIPKQNFLHPNIKRLPLFSKVLFFLIFYSYSMGGQDSKPKEQDFFFLEHISKMSLTNRKTVSYYLIHPHRDSGIEEALKGLRAYFKVDLFPQIKTLKQEMAFVNKHQIVKVVVSTDLPQADVEYLQNQEKIYQIVLLGPNKYSSKFSKTVRVVDKPSDLLHALTELEQKDSLTISSSNILLVDSDTKMLNKYRLNYHCNTTYNGRSQAKEDFIALAKHIFPNQKAEIQNFAKEYNLELTGQEKKKMVLSWGFKNSFFWQMVSQLTRNTTDPKRLAYIRLALKDLFETIADEFKTKKTYGQIHIVVDVTEEQKQKLEKAKGKFIIFTSFIKGYVTEKQANAELKKRPNAFKFIVMPNRGQLDPSLDFGYVIDKESQPSVIYNIYNVFRVDDINIKTRRGEILYGALPESIVKRGVQQNRQKMTLNQLNLVRNFDFLEDSMSKIDSQATLLQLYGYHNESLEVYSKKVETLRKTNDSEQNVGRCLIRKADALRISGDVDGAQKEYQSVASISERMKIISLIHLAELYLQKGQEDKFNDTVNKFANEVKSISQSDREEYFRAYNLIAIRCMNIGDAENLIKAERILGNIQQKISQLYSHKIEGMAINHDIRRTTATVQLKQDRHTDALLLLKETLGFQVACEGNTANVALTESLIQTVCRSTKKPSADFETELQQSLARMSTISEEIESSECRLQSIIGSNLNKSVVSISLSK